MEKALEVVGGILKGIAIIVGVQLALPFVLAFVVITLFTE